MAEVTETCNIKQITISQVSKLKSICTSEVFIYGISWKVKVYREESWLKVMLVCNIDDDSPNWSVSGAVSCKLLPFSDDLNALEVHSKPVVLDRTQLHGFGLLLIQWNDLIDENNKYVKDDAIKLEIKIQVENPNDPNRSVVQLWRDCGKTAKFQLIVKNVSNLMAVQTCSFKLYGLSWYITVGKDSVSNDLYALLDFLESEKNNSCDVTWSIKLMSLKEDVKPIGKTETDRLSWSTFSCMDSIASWDEVCKPENGFVNNDSITLEVELKSNKPRQSVANNTPTAKRVKREPSPSTE